MNEEDTDRTAERAGLLKRSPRVQRIDGPRKRLLVFTLSSGGTTFCLAVDGDGRLGTLDGRLKGDPADAFVMRLRKLIGRATLVAIEEHQDGPRTQTRIRFRGLGSEVGGAPSEMVLSAEDGELRLRRLPDGAPLAGQRRFAAVTPPETWTEVASIPAFTKPKVEPVAVRNRKLLERARKRLAKKLAKIEADAARVEDAPGLRLEADLLTAALSSWPSDALRHEVLDWTTDQPRVLELAAGETPSLRADRLYRRARKLERGAKIALERAAVVRATLERVDGALASDHADAARTMLQSLGIRVEGQSLPKKNRATGRRPDRVFRTDGERTIRVGRSARDNDLVTQSAKPHDLWLHARGVTGAHVIVPLGKREVCPSQLLADAAMLAAHFSESARELRVEVQYCRRHQVRKPRKAPPGLVTVQQERVLLVEMRQPRIRWLLEQEVR